MAPKRASSVPNAVGKKRQFRLGPQAKNAAEAHRRLDELGAKLNNEFDAIGRTLSGLVEFLKVSFDKDGHVKPEAVRRALDSVSSRREG